jgi:hypothetical protein
VLDAYAPGQRGKGAFVARLLHEHAVCEELRAAAHAEAAQRETQDTTARTLAAQRESLCADGIV